MLTIFPGLFPVLGLKFRHTVEGKNGTHEQGLEESVLGERGILFVESSHFGDRGKDTAYVFRARRGEFDGTEGIASGVIPLLIDLLVILCHLLVVRLLTVELGKDLVAVIGVGVKW